MNTDIRLKTSFLAHHKTLKLKKKLGPEGVLSLIALWLYVAQYRPDGDISDISIEDLAAVSMWEKDPNHFVNTLIEVGFIDESLTPEGAIKRTIHDWKEHNAYAAGEYSRKIKATINTIKRWIAEGKYSLGELMHHDNPQYRKAAAILMRQRRDNVGLNARSNVEPNASPNVGANVTPENGLKSSSTGVTPQDTTQDTPETLPKTLDAPSPSLINKHIPINSYISQKDNSSKNKRGFKGEKDLFQQEQGPASTEVVVGESKLSPLIYGEKILFMDNVLLTEKEYQSLIEKIGQDKTDYYIEQLNNYIHIIGKQKATKKYHSHYHVILTWHRKDENDIKKRIAVAEAIQKRKEEEYFR